MKRQQRSSPARLRSNGYGAPSVHRQAARPNGGVNGQLQRLSERMDQMERELDQLSAA
jgi:hypothetical protein